MLSVQTRILSVVAWYHLAFFAISMTMFGLTVGLSPARQIHGADPLLRFALLSAALIVNNDYPAIAATLSPAEITAFPRADSNTAVTSTTEDGPLPLVRTKSWRVWNARSVAR